ncbi:ARGOS-like protein [Lycium ferocissimum]|uniref:ARGOS-like protein n=1 Tax=Lycium ferocissimum TaxID=112874 RepID=UPI002815CAA1|nr:ARGOS-like protein [Lycium ferocissimum]
MDVKAVKNSNDEYFHRKNGITTNLVEGKKIEYSRLFSQGQYGKRNVSSSMSYFSLVSLLFLTCVTVSLLLLPLILPPLPPPPPFILLLLPVFILLLLMVLAFMPSNNVM